MPDSGKQLSSYYLSVDVDYTTDMPSGQPISMGAANGFSLVAIFLDSMQTNASGKGIAMSLLASSFGPLGFAGAQGAYEGSLLGWSENLLGVTSFAATVSADLFAGNTYPHPDGGWVFGQDTYVSATMMMAGWIPFGPYYDTVINFTSLQYGASGFNDKNPAIVVRNNLPGNILVKRIALTERNNPD